MADTRKPIEALPKRWKPSADPANIQIPGLDTNASVVDQIEQIEQLITIKLQVRALRMTRIYWYSMSRRTSMRISQKSTMFSEIGSYLRLRGTR